MRNGTVVFLQQYLLKTTGYLHRRRSRQIFGGVKDFCPNFPKLVRKCFVRLLPTNFLPQSTWIPVVGVTPKKVLIVFFCKRWAPFFEVKQCWAPFLPGFSEIVHWFSEVLPNFSGILPKVSTNQNFWGCAFTPASYTTGYLGNEISVIFFLFYLRY